MQTTPADPETTKGVEPILDEDTPWLRLSGAYEDDRMIDAVIEEIHKERHRQKAEAEGECLGELAVEDALKTERSSPNYSAIY